MTAMNYSEALARIRHEAARAQELKTIDNGLYTQQMIQLLNSCEGLKTKALGEIERLQGLIGECRGKIQGAEVIQTLLIDIMSSYNRKEEERLREETMLAKEKAKKKTKKAVKKRVNRKGNK